MSNFKGSGKDNTNQTIRSFASSRSGNSYYSETEDPYDYDENENVIDVLRNEEVMKTGGLLYCNQKFHSISSEQI